MGKSGTFPPIPVAEKEKDAHIFAHGFSALNSAVAPFARQVLKIGEAWRPPAMLLLDLGGMVPTATHPRKSNFPDRGVCSHGLTVCAE